MVSQVAQASIHDSSIEQAAPEWLTDDPRWIAVEKIANSDGFRRSVRLREFLLYISTQYLSGHAEEITEQNIGHRIYHRRETYSPAEDNIVRVSARQLRLKLKEYYETEGKDSEWIVDVPKGGYIPDIHQRQTSSEPPSMSPTVPEKRSSIPKWIPTVSIAIAAAVAGWMIPHRSQSPVQPPSPNLITMIFGQSRSPVQVIVSDPALSISQAIENQNINLSSYSRGNYYNLPATLDKNALATRLWYAVTGRQLVNIGDVQAAIRFRDALATTPFSPTIVVRSAANVNARDMRTGNFILMGGADSDPWVRLFSDDHLDFRFVSGGPNQQLAVQAMDPKTGKQQRYSPQNNSGYARIALVPNLTETGKVFLIAGTSMESTESAANFCLDAQSSKALLAALGTDNPAKMPYFEALLQTNEASGTGLNAKVVAIRLIKSPGG